MPQEDEFLQGLMLRPFGEDIDLTKWDCSDAIDWFLRNAASEFHQKNLSTVTCWLADTDLAGYVATSMTQVEIESKDRRLPRKLGLAGLRLQPEIKIKRFPALLIGMLGVCKAYRRRGLGTHMVKWAIGQATEFSDKVGCRFVTVDSEPTPEAVGMYEGAGFVAPEDQDRERSVWMYYDLGPRPPKP